MNTEDTTSPQEVEPLIIPVEPPYIWPEARYYVGQAQYKNQPPFDELFAQADLISGVLVGTADQTIAWIDGLMRYPGACQIRLVIVVYPAGPTREEHLIGLKMLAAEFSKSERKIEVRLFLVDRAIGDDHEKMVLPPTVLQAHNTVSGKTSLCIGSVGDTGRDKIRLASFNVVFQPDDALRDSWRRWFQYIFSMATPLTTDTVHIPHLVPAKGDPAAAAKWKAYENTCGNSWAQQFDEPMVDSKTGEVTVEVDGTEVKAWDDGKTKLDPLALKLQQVYAKGCLVTVDETTRIKPLDIPVKAVLMGQQAQRRVGNLTQRQSFSLQVLDEIASREVEKCRNVTDLVDLLTFQLSKGNRWIPETAKSLLEKELKARNQKGSDSLKGALGGDVQEFIVKHRERIRKDLDGMYSQLGQGTRVPEDKFNAVLDEVTKRFKEALAARITPRSIYNRIAAPDLTAGAPAENWNQPFALLIHSARLLRKSLTDSYFPRKLSGMSFVEKDFLDAMNVFGDVMLKESDRHRAQDELLKLEEIEANAEDPKQKCKAVWRIITGDVLG